MHERCYKNKKGCAAYPATPTKVVNFQTKDMLGLQHKRAKTKGHVWKLATGRAGMLRWFGRHKKGVVFYSNYDVPDFHFLP